MDIWVVHLTAGQNACATATALLKKHASITSVKIHAMRESVALMLNAKSSIIDLYVHVLKGSLVIHLLVAPQRQVF